MNYQHRTRLAWYIIAKTLIIGFFRMRQSILLLFTCIWALRRELKEKEYKKLEKHFKKNLYDKRVRPKSNDGILGWTGWTVC